MKNQVLLNRQDQAESLAELGGRLQRFRQQQGLSLEQVAAKTHIPIRTLTAIEAGQLERLPEPVYIQGFIRRYAEALGMDGSEFAVAFPTLPSTDPARSFWNLSVRAQLRPLHLYLLYMALVAGAVSGLSSLLNRSATIASAPMPLATGQVTSPVPLVPPLGTQPFGPPNPLASASSLPSPPTPKNSSTATTKPVRVGLKLTDQSWLRIVADGKTEFEGVLPEGTQRLWVATQEVTVRAGNAGGVIVTYNDGKAKPLGDPGSVEEVTFGTKSQSANWDISEETLTALSAVAP
jgi:cytoskeletal protein RodZ